MSGPIPPPPDRRQFMGGAFGTSAYVEAMAKYTAEVAVRSLEVMERIEKTLEHLSDHVGNVDGFLEAYARKHPDATGAPSAE